VFILSTTFLKHFSF